MADFIGRANFIPGETQAKHGDNLTVSVFGEVIELTNIIRDFQPNEAVNLIVRPEMIRIKKSW